jgi:hypothetical protein
MTNPPPDWWSAFTAAPWIFVSIAGVLVVGAGGFVRWLDDKHIKTLEAQVSAQKDRIIALETRPELPAPKGMISRAQSVGLPVQDLTAVDLRDKAFELARVLRSIQEFAHVYPRTFRQPNATEAERAAAWDRERQIDDARRAEISRRYGIIQGEAIAVRDELMRRASRQILVERDQYVNHTYEHPVGAGPFTEIANDLETLALTLPE